jgi:hypothetical protein
MDMEDGQWTMNGYQPFSSETQGCLFNVGIRLFFKEDGGVIIAVIVVNDLFFPFFSIIFAFSLQRGSKQYIYSIYMIWMIDKLLLFMYL